ncbi:hypothetical protein N7522_011657 [Penicillium canescens]|uniref:Uncharacterized protein n=1 Tax=Penicillium canescens TaxID=5083 RepID=A0AAD6IMV4_PENCN|nr:uncharacterized protein N7446_007373 [Penicillium canescens]KAJ5991450.1 hypothetical protein N7522_011657 [Penicillium canescens]KAJ6049297.1 hypothetical protein N7444_006013 [Penicillium canescens]KAJ6052730.1 hypothetical protein N7460_003264 [Penicillium canescens]KAJ6063253.1 hypothetical protein N7446_007373 [Penicillium canescens]
MAPIDLSVRSHPDYYDNPEKEEFLGWYIFGWVMVGLAAIILAFIWAKCKDKLMPKLQQCKEDLGEKMTWKSSEASEVIAKPKSAHVANHHTQEVAGVDRITADLTPEYLKKTTAVMGCL